MKQLMLGFVIFSLIVTAQIGAAPGSSSAPASPSLPLRIDYPRLAALLADKGSGLLLLDVRTAEEYAGGYIPGAILAPYDGLEKSFKEPQKARPIVVYCRSGRRSAIAQTTLKRMGYTNVSDFGAIDNWKGRLER